MVRAGRDVMMELDRREKAKEPAGVSGSAEERLK